MQSSCIRRMTEDNGTRGVVVLQLPLAVALLLLRGKVTVLIAAVNVGEMERRNCTERHILC